MTDNHMGRAQTFVQQRLDKGVGGNVRHFCVEPTDQQGVDAQRRGRAHLAAKRRQAERFVIGPEKPARMGPKGHQRHGLPQSIGLRTRGRQDHLVALVQAIEVADRDHRAAGVGRDAGNVPE